MNIYDKEMGLKFFMYTKGLPALIIVDLFLITISLIFQIPKVWMDNIQLFDWIVCIILLGEYFLNLHMSSPKRDYILDVENIIGLIASIPFDLILMFTPFGVPVYVLRYLRLFKLIRMLKLAQFDYVKDLFRKTGLHKILGIIVITIVLFTILFSLFGPSYGGFDDFYYVIVTLTTVGYGDKVPTTYNEKVMAIILILFGIFVFSTVTAAISSFLTDRILDEDDEMIDKIREVIEENTENIMDELESVRTENRQLKDELNELKNRIDEK